MPWDEGSKVGGSWVPVAIDCFSLDGYMREKYICTLVNVLTNRQADDLIGLPLYTPLTSQTGNQVPVDVFSVDATTATKSVPTKQGWCVTIYMSVVYSTGIVHAFFSLMGRDYICFHSFVQYVGQNESHLTSTKIWEELLNTTWHELKNRLY